MSQSKWKAKDRQYRSSQWFSLDSPKSYAFVFFVVLAAIWGVWQYWNYDFGPYEITQDVPVIRAEPGPYRMRPENYGHVNVPHQDKVIFDVMQDNPDDVDGVRAQSGEEDPLPLEKSDDVPTIAPDPFTEITADEAAEEKALKEESKSKAEGASAEDKTVADKKEEDEGGTGEDTAEPAKGDAKAALKTGSVNPPTRAEIAKKGEYWVRMATTQTYDSALSEWKRVSEKFKDELNGKEGTVAMIDLDSGKKLYPLYVGPYDTMEVARKTCAKIRDRIGCMTEQLKPNS